jgi:hypothetical protein
MASISIKKKQVIKNAAHRQTISPEHLISGEASRGVARWRELKKERS